jgi:hypothetical protein
MDTLKTASEQKHLLGATVGRSHKTPQAEHPTKKNKKKILKP